MKLWFAVLITAVILAGCTSQSQNEQTNVEGTSIQPLPPSGTLVPLHVVKINASQQENNSSAAAQPQPNTTPQPNATGNPTSPLQIATSSLPSGKEGTPYIATLAATGGAQPYTWAVTGLPLGLYYGSAGIVGTPSSGTGGASPYSITVSVTDANQQTVVSQLSLAIAAPLRAPRLLVITHVDNSKGGGLSADDFNVTVKGSGPVPNNFSGSESGMQVVLDEGSYAVNQTNATNYSLSFSQGCSGFLSYSQSETCTITTAYVQNESEGFNFTDDFSSYGSVSGLCLPDGTSFGQWYAVYSGYGCVKVDGYSLRETPGISYAEHETHAALVVGPLFSNPFTFQVNAQTLSQLRIGPDPNAWEMAWVLWHYTDDEHFYYFIAKPNGWELGKEDPACSEGQCFLATGSSPTYPVGGTNQVKIDVDGGNTIRAYVNGQLVTTYTDATRPYTSGLIGLYTEDADVRFTSVRAEQR